MRKSAKVLNIGLVVSAAIFVAAKRPESHVNLASDVTALWRDPGDGRAKDLFYGPGGKEHEPRGGFSFVEEDRNGTHPKIVVRDDQGIRWTVKLGSEAAPETAAARLVWAAGYYANEDYFMREITIRDLPARLHRGQKLMLAGGVARNVRLKRHIPHEKKIDNWSWEDNPFTGTRELNGLRVLMALLNNWDLTEENNAVYEEPDGGRIFMVSDLGATFGAGRLTWPSRKNMGDAAAYRHSKFITSSTADTVDFHTPGLDSPLFLATPREYFAKVPLRRIAKGVPVADARWLGELLARIPADRIEEAFRAAGYSGEEAARFREVIEQRISALRRL